MTNDAVADPPSPDVEKLILLKLLSQVTGPLSECMNANQAVVAEMEKLQKGRSDQLTVYSAAQAATAACNNSESELHALSAPDGITADARGAIDKALSDSCPNTAMMYSAAWQNFSKMVDAGGSLSGQYQMKQDADAATLNKIQCLAAMIGRLSQLHASDNEVSQADSGV